MADEHNNEKLRKLIAGGSEIAGGAVGGALGFLAGGPIGAAVLGAGGAVAAQVLKQIGEEASERLLGPREKVRVGAVLALTASAIHDRTKGGEKIRADGFFEAKADGRCDAEEVAESVLQKCQREAEEKKVVYIGNLLSNVSFDSKISGPMAHQLLKAAEQLTYRQFCILKLAVVKDSFGLRATDYRGVGEFARDLYQILYECHDLYHRGFINFGGEVAFGPTDVAPGKMTVQGLGGDLFKLMKLGGIPNSDLSPIAAQLK